MPGEGQYVATLRKHGDADSLSADPFLLFKAEHPAVSDAPRDPVVNVDRATALRYLHGDAVVLPEDAPVGPVVIAFEGHPLGPAKNLGRRCNNLYPKSRRIRMDV